MASIACAPNRSHQQQHIHPLVAELCSSDAFESSSSSSSNATTKARRVSSSAILSYLLEREIVTPEALRSVHAILVPQHNSKSASSTVTATAKPSHSVSASTKAPASQRTNANRGPATSTLIRKRHVALRVYYDGGAYSGLAENVGSDMDQSVERALFAALRQAHLVVAATPTTTTLADATTDTTTTHLQSNAGTERDGYSRCGRTDKGVSAVGQVVALQLKSAFSPLAARHEPRQYATDDSSPTSPTNNSDSVPCLTNDELPRNSHDSISVWVPRRSNPSKKSSATTPPSWVHKDMSEYAYDKILNNLLPPDIRVLGWTPVSDEFSARFSATTRVYRYFFVPRSMDLDRMNLALQRCVGTHDFRNFCKMDVEKVYNFERTIHSAEIVSSGESSYLLIVGTAFLWHQIRCMAAILFLVGRGLEEPSIISELLDVTRHPRKPSYALADERPLVLHDCLYKSLTIGYSTANLYNLECHFEQQWEDCVLAAARVRNCIESLQDRFVVTSDLQSFASSKIKQRRKKRSRKQSGVSGTGDFRDESDQEMPRLQESATDHLTWKDAKEWLAKSGLIPDPDRSIDMAYTPLLQRAKGTSYEEKIAALQHSSKRRQKYEDNVIKKRKSAEEDAKFYAYMTKQGGSAM